MNITQNTAQSGRIIAENGEVVNIVDLLGGGNAIGDADINITQFAARSGRVIGEDGKVYNLVDLLGNVGSPTDEQIQQAVDSYLTENPVTGGATEEEAQQIEQNKNDISALKTSVENADFVWSITSAGAIKLKYDILNEITIPLSVNGIDVKTVDMTSLSSKITMRKLVFPDELEISTGVRLPNCKNLETLVFGNKITRWATETLARDCPNLTTVTFNAPLVNDFPKYAFMGCGSLTSIAIPEGVTQCFHCFTSCTALKTVTFPTTMKEISYHSFYNCTALESIEIPENVETIHSTAFGNCSNLKTITINKPADSITGAPWGATNATVIWAESEEV